MTRKKYHQRWYRKNKKRVNALARVWRKKNKKRIAEISRAWVKKNKKRQKENCKRWYRRNKKRADANSRAWASRNRKRVCKQSKEWRKKHPKRAKATRFKRQYGITLEDFSAVRKTQKNRCAICYKRFLKSPHVDHDHETGEFRGLLCLTCNAGIGLLKDSIVIVESAAKYLRRSK